MLLLKFADKQAMSVFASMGLYGSVNKFPNAYDYSDQALELITLSIFFFKAYFLLLVIQMKQLDSPREMDNVFSNHISHNTRFPAANH